jgi:hypothetical protein
LVGTLIVGVGQASIAAGASPLAAAGISVGSQWTFEVQSPIYQNGWGCEVQTMYEKGGWRSDEGGLGAWRVTKKGTTLREAFGGSLWIFTATYAASTTYFSGGSGPGYVGLYHKDRTRLPAELVPGAVAGC